MSEQDSFINEVSEEVRRDKLFATFRKYGWIAAAAVVLIVGGASVNEYLKAREVAAAEAAGNAMLAALDAGSPAEQAAALSQLDGGDSAERRALFRMMGANVEVTAGNVEAGAAMLDAISADVAVPDLYRDLATLKSMILSTDLLTPEERINRLDPLAVPGRPFRLLALEQIALAQVQADDIDAARATAQTIVGDNAVTQDLRGRMQQLIVALGGSLSET